MIDGLELGSRVLKEKKFTPDLTHFLVRVIYLNGRADFGAASGADDPNYFNLLFVGFFIGNDALCRWFRRYAEWAGIEFPLILSEMAIPLARANSTRTRRLQSEDVERALSPDFFYWTYLGVKILAQAWCLKEKTAKPDQLLDVRHVLGVFLYGMKEYDQEFATRDRKYSSVLKGWHLDQEDCSNAFITYIRSCFPDETVTWEALYKENFDSEIVTPHPAQFDLAREGEVYETMFDMYRPTKLLGQGGSGKVYRVLSQGGQEYALKCLDARRSSSDKVKRFKREVDYCIRARHKNIIQIEDYGIRVEDDQKTPFYVMPLLPSTLRKRLQRGIAPMRVIPQFMGVLDGMAEAHRNGVWHRDLKPENILYREAADPCDALVVADFGIAHFEEDELHSTVLTDKRDRLANFQYAAPEQRVPGKEVDCRADIYALGLILNEMFTGEVIQGAGYKTVSSVAPDFGALDPIIERMVHQAPASRPRDLDEVRTMLADFGPRS
jgi:hypothetical protein